MLYRMCMLLSSLRSMSQGGMANGGDNGDNGDVASFLSKMVDLATFPMGESRGV